MKKLLCVAVAAMALLGGCATVQMQPAELVKTAKQQRALVTFVRPAVFFGDGIAVDVWDGANYLGSLSAGSLIQHEVAPGKHLFLANGENWSYASGEFQAGKSYVLKVNIFPGVMAGRVALGTVPPSDPRMGELMALKPTAATAQGRQEVSAKKQPEVQAAIAHFNAGKVTSFATVTPADGR